MLLFIPRSLCALKRVAAKAEHARFGATQGIRIALSSGLYRAEATDGHRAIVVQGMVPAEAPPWPGLKELPDDAFQAIILPKDLERACKIGEAVLQNRFDAVGIATMGSDVCLGLGSDLVTAQTVEGRFPALDQAMPKKRPLFTFRIDPKVLAETLLAMADLLPEGSKAVQCFFYGDNLPIGFCVRNSDNGTMIDALVVPLVAPKPDPKAAEGKAEDKPQEEDPKPNGRRRKKDEPAPEANGQPPDEASPEAAAQEPPAPDAAQDANGQEPKPKRSKKS